VAEEQVALGIIERLGKSTLTVVLFVMLFLMGAGITSNTLKEIGVRPLIQGVTLWIVAASLSHGPSIWDGSRYKASPCYWL
jgi:hypothetical protein